MDRENNDQKSFSSHLLDALRLKGLSTEKLGALTGISDRFIELLLEEKFEKLPAAPYIHGYIVKIAEALNLKGEDLWHEFLKDNDAVRRSGSKDKLPPNRFANSKFGKKNFLVIASAIVVIFIAFQIPKIFGNPSVDFINLADNLTVQSANFTVIGKVQPNDQLTLNGESVYPDSNGNFQKNIHLDSGLNVLTFKVKKFLGKESTVVKQIFYEAPKLENQTQLNGN
ncbi:MAG: helix-turn-helix domain-containing protein [Patescibacteria group bacterium]